MLLAEVLDADWSKIGYDTARVDYQSSYSDVGMQSTGGRSSVWSGYEQYRNAGAAARAMLIAAAAVQWNADPATLRTESGAVLDGANRKLSYGQLAEAAAKMTPPQKVTLKDSKAFKLIGTPVKRLDTPEKINGKAVFGIDVKNLGMLTAVVARAPVFGAKVKSFDDSHARAMPGVRKIVAVPSGVAVVADSFWQAKLARDAVRIDWDEGPMHAFSTAQMMQQFREQAKPPGQSARREGGPDAAARQVGAKSQ